MRKYYSLEELKDPETVNEIIGRWGEIGFLEQSRNKKNVALSCELLGYRLIHSSRGRYNAKLSVLMFPVAVRIARCFPDDVTVEYIQEVIIDATDNFPMEQLLALQKQDKAKHLGDIEAITVSKYSDEVIKELGLTPVD